MAAPPSRLDYTVEAPQAFFNISNVVRVSLLPLDAQRQVPSSPLSSSAATAFPIVPGTREAPKAFLPAPAGLCRGGLSWEQ